MGEYGIIMSSFSSSNSLDLKLSKNETERGENINGKGGFDFGTFFQNNKLSVGLGLMGVFLLGVGILATVFLSSKKDSTSIEIISASANPSATNIFIHVSRAVEKPGLYQLNPDARVNDALIAAGGLSVQADRDWFNKTVNLAQKLSDGIKIYIPFANANVPAQGWSASGRKTENSNLNMNGTVAGEQTSIFVQETQGKININTALLSQLETLSGIGPAFSQRIIDYRNTNGPFAKIEDIMKVSGIGEKTFAKFKDKITI